MFINYIKIALRNFRRHKVYSLITISGLILGLSVFSMFALLTNFTSNVDSFHAEADRIYALIQVFAGGQEGDQHSAITPAPLAPALKSEFPEIEKAVRYFPPGRMIVKYKDKVFYESGLRFVDPEFLSIFSFKMKTGDKDSVLSSSNSIVLTEDSALKYFGDEDPLGKTLTLDNEIDVVVSGIVENTPLDSSINFDFLVPMETARSLNKLKDDWTIRNQAAFLLLAEGIAPDKLEAKFSSFIDKYYSDTHDSPIKFYMHPLLDFYLGSLDIERTWSSGQISYVGIWIVAVLLLLIACINFMNISTARYLTRAQEVGMRKVVGANRSQLIKQFLGESIFMTLISLPAAIILYELLRPVFAANLGEIFDISLLNCPQVLLLLFGVAIFTGFFAGSYPAFYLSAFKPVLVLKKNLSAGKKGSRFRNTLVIVQFTFSIILILITVISVKQSRHNQNVDLGFNRSHIIAVTLNEKTRDKVEIFKNELVRHKDILSVSAAAALPIEWNSESSVLPEGKIEDDAFNMNTYGIDYGFIEQLEIDIVQGRTFSREYQDEDFIILNEKAVEQLQWKDPLGKRMVVGKHEKTVIGVVKDYHFKSIYLGKITSALMYLGADNLNYMLVKYSYPESLESVTEFIREKWNIAAAGLPFEYITLDNVFNDVLQGDKTSQMTGTLGVLAIFLSCLGLFGLSSYSVERRIKEIGIRKVLGASVSRIVRMLTKDFIKLVAVANIIAMPIAYFMMNAIFRFVYAYPIKIKADIFFLTAGLTLVIAFMTVASQTIKSALANPVNSLKYE